MRHLSKFLLIVLLGWVSSFFVPFWGIAIAAFLVSLVIRTSGLSSFIIGLLAIFLLWGVSAYVNEVNTSGILTNRISQLFSVDPPILILITGFIGGITGALGSLTGSYFRNLIS